MLLIVQQSLRYAVTLGDIGRPLIHNIIPDIRYSEVSYTRTRYLRKNSKQYSKRQVKTVLLLLFSFAPVREQ